jgi:hypothetical protein
MARDYKVTVNFGGYIGCDITYEVYAENEEDAIEQARELVLDECNFEIDDDDDEESED